MLPQQHAELSFYGENIELAYPAELFANGNLPVSETGIATYLNSLEAKDWESFSSQLEAYKLRWQLNDWLYFKLINQSLDQIAGFTSTAEQRLIEYHLLALSGYDVKLCWDASKDEVFVYVFSDEALFEVPMIEDGSRKYINITAALTPRKHHSRSLNLHSSRPNPNGKSFSFSLKALPLLRPQLVERPYFFNYHGRPQVIRASSDRTIVEWMKDYPFFSEGLYMEIPLSPAANAQLLGQLRDSIAAMSEVEALSYLAAFTRGAFDYKEDKESFGFSKPMIAEETLFYAQSDCEDRSALYFGLVKELLNLPVIAIAYDDHLSIAVSSDELRGRPYWHEGRKYRVCDPTGPAGSSEIGNPPYGYANRRFEVVASYTPEVLPKGEIAAK
jgi:hypothetical protein